MEGGNKPQWMRFFDDQMIKVETSHGGSPEYNPNQDLIMDNYSHQEYMDREVEMPAISQTQNKLDPNVQIFEVKCNPELNFAYVDVKNQQ